LNTSGTISKDSISRAAQKEILQHPLVVYPGAIGVVATASSLLFSPALFFGGWLAVGGLGISALSLVVNTFFRAETFESASLKKQLKLMKAEKETKIKNIPKALLDIKGDAILTRFIEQGQYQFKMIQQKTDTFKAILDEKLHGEELMHQRYLGTVDQVMLSILDHLISVTLTLKAASAIDAQRAELQLKQLKSMEKTSPLDLSEIKTLEERLQLRSSYLHKVDSWLTTNEKALTEVDRMTLAISEMDKAQLAGIDPETARQNLQRMAEKVLQRSQTPTNHFNLEA
jgi:hypothetical protein